MVFEGILTGSYFGSDIAQYTAFFTAVILATIGAKILYFFVNKYGKFITRKTKTDFDDVLLDAMGTPMVFAGFVAGLVIGYQYLTPDNAFILGNFSKAIEALIILDLTWFSLKVIDGIIDHFLIPLSEKTESKLDDQLIPVLRKLAKFSVILISLIVILSNFGIDVLPLIAGLGIGGVAVAFAAQKTVEDMFGGLSIFTSKPFTVGDAIRVGSVEGTVDAVGIRNTRIIDWDGRLNTLPNSTIARGEILNISSEPARRVSMTLGLTYSTSHAKMNEAMKILKNIANKHPDTEHDNVRAVFKNYGSSSLDIWFVYYIKNQPRKFEVMSEINMEIKKQFEKAKLDFAYPSQSIYLESMPQMKKKGQK